MFFFTPPRMPPLLILPTPSSITMPKLNILYSNSAYLLRGSKNALYGDSFREIVDGLLFIYVAGVLYLDSVLHF
jgi:hypothetical protein